MKTVTKWFSRKLLVAMVAMVMVAVGGCEKLPGLLNRETGKSLPDAEVANLPVEERASYDKPVVIHRLDQGVIDQIVGGLNVAKDVEEKYGGLLGPWAEVVGGVITLALLGFGYAKNVKVVKQRDNAEKKRVDADIVVANMREGLAITAKAVNEFVRPVEEVWTKFKAAQRSGASGTNAIMPDKV